ncbi:helix-turn-helix transcriptional regulator [Neobacillus sp. CF12]|uniref:helix-turn-helix domain-containing protein n=1 Tax=Neobacillus sp. CF12 TaxID=3055864 RepID=UPI0025A07E0F|nr:helix-turn-helix transcriptional regulator [Neobacillus sp. CF12]MDM5329895.1 helix-turn-helix transcriptional regulator [Neobacillus sp. CF12]
MNTIVVVKLKTLLMEKGITTRELSRRTDLRHATISELANQKRLSAHFPHLASIAHALDIEDMNQIITFEKIED